MSRIDFFAQQKNNALFKSFLKDREVPPSPKAMAGQGRRERKAFLQKSFLSLLQNP